MLKLLIAEDDEVLAQHCARFFRGRQWEVHVVANARELLDLLDATFDAVLLDDHMPDAGDGMRALIEIRKRSALESVCVVILTAYASQYNAGEVAALGAQQFLSKPTDPLVILRLLQSGIAMRKAQALYRSLLSTFNLAKVLQRVHSVPLTVIQPGRLYLALRVGDVFTETAFTGTAVTQGSPLRLDAVSRRFIREILESGQPVFEQNPADAATWDGLLPGCKSLLVVPVLAGQGEIAGIFGLESAEPNAFDYPWLEIMTSLANIVGIAMEIAEKAKLRVEQEYWRRMPEMLAQLGHRIATPLQVIDMQVDRLLRTDLQEGLSVTQIEEVRRRLKVISNNVENIARVRKTLGTVSSDIAVSQTPCDLAAVLSACLEEFRPISVDKQIELAVSMLEPTLVRADAGSVQYSLQCLLSNAFDAIERRREQDQAATEDLDLIEQRKAEACIRVDLRTDQARGEAVVSVADTGIGIPKENKGRVFEPLFTTKKHGDLHGIGLFSVNRIMSKLEGSISFTSEPGKGTTFDLCFPLSRNSAGSVPGEQATDDAPKG